MLKSGVGCLRKVEMGWSCHDWPTGPMVGFCARPTHLILSVIAGEPPNLNPQQQQQKCRHSVTHRYHGAVETEHAVERKICLRSRNCKKLRCCMLTPPLCIFALVAFPACAPSSLWQFPLVYSPPIKRPTLRTALKRWVA